MNAEDRKRYATMARDLRPADLVAMIADLERTRAKAQRAAFFQGWAAGHKRGRAGLAGTAATDWKLRGKVT